MHTLLCCLRVGIWIQALNAKPQTPVVDRPHTSQHLGAGRCRGVRRQSQSRLALLRAPLWVATGRPSITLPVGTVPGSNLRLTPPMSYSSYGGRQCWSAEKARPAIP